MYMIGWLSACDCYVGVLINVSLLHQMLLVVGVSKFMGCMSE